jgi:methionyl-tRNA synthetase
MNEMEQNNAPAAEPAAAPAAPAEKQFITIDDVMKVELRVAEIKVAERIPKSDKLLRLEVDLGTETRQILAGIAEHYAPETLIGRRVIIVANLAPRKMRGLESQGMLLAASLGDADKPSIAGFLDSVELGARVK